MEKKLLSIPQAAEYMGISKGHLYKLTCEKKIKHFKSGGGKFVYFDKDDLDKYIQGVEVFAEPRKEIKKAPAAKSVDQVVMCYKCDVNHSWDSMDLFAVVTKGIDEAINVCKLKAKKEGSRISKYQLYLLETIKQTQGFSGSGEFYLEVFEKDELNKIL